MVHNDDDTITGSDDVAVIDAMQSETDASKLSSFDSKPKTKNSGRKRASDNGKITVNDKFIIYPHDRIAEFEHPYADAYAASDVNETEPSYIAMVIKGRYPVRYDIFYVVSQLENKNIIGLKDWGYVWWPDEKRVRYAIILQKPAGKRLMANMSIDIEPFNEDMLKFAIIRPVFQTIREMFDKGAFHGCVNLMNLYRSTTDNSNTILGECVSTSPGLLQPILFETIERAMCDPNGKGSGQIRDDVYALGVSVAILARGFNPLRGKKDREIIEMKEEKGSFALLTEGLRMSPAISEFLRGTLTDDMKGRWGVEEISAWFDGNRSPSKQKVNLKRAARAFEYGGRKHWKPRSLAVDLALNPSKSMEIIEDGSLAQWLARSISSQEMADNVNEAITRAQMNGRGEGYSDRLVTYVSMVLDPMAPIRYRGVNVLPQGVGWAMAHAYAEGKSIQTLAELVRDRYAWTWLGFKENMSIDTQDLLRNFDNTSKLISRRGLEFGVERCLYELCKFSPCMSDKLQEYYVIDCEDMLRALDDIGEDADKDRKNVIEKHIMAFIAARDKKDLAGIFRLIESVDRIKSSLALVTMYRDLQFRYYRNPLPGLSKWLGRYCVPIVDRYHNRETRKDIMDKLDKTIQTGDLNKIISLVDSPSQVRKDEYEFQKTKKLFVEIDIEKDHLKHSMMNDKSFGLDTGRQVAAIISGAIGAVLIAAVLMIRLTM